MYSTGVATDNRAIFKVRLQWLHYLIQIQKKRAVYSSGQDEETVDLSLSKLN